MVPEEGTADSKWQQLTRTQVQCAGFIASAVHSYDGTNHLAFLASFATITYVAATCSHAHCILTSSRRLAPLFLSIALFTTFGRLSQVVTPLTTKTSGSRWVYFIQRLGTFVLLPSLVPFAMFLYAFSNLGRFLSPMPIDGGRNEAFRRLLNYELGLSQLEKAHASHAALCFMFAIMAAVFTLKSKSWTVDNLTVRNNNWRELLHTINIANAAVLLRACYKAYECREIAASRAALGDGGALFWLLDVLPMLASLVVFCGVKPTSYLPESHGSITLDMEASYTDEKADLRLLQ